MSKIKVGVVENEMVIADTICLTLRKLGYEVVPAAHNYATAIRMIDTHQPDLLLLDINLGGLKDGIDVAHYAKERHEVPIIYLTANSDRATVDRAKQTSPNAYLVKPFNKDDLYTAIEIAISNHTATTPINKAQESLLIKNGYDFEKVHFRDILYVSSEQNYVTFHLSSGKKSMMRSTLQETMDRLPASLFLKINRSFIISLRHVSKIETEKVFLGELDFPIAKPVKDQLLLQVQAFL